MVATFPGAGSPPACGGPSGGGRNGSISTTFRWYDATRHRRPRERIRRRLWTRPCGKVAVRQGVPHHTDGDQDHRFGQPQPWLSTPRAPARAPSPLDPPGTDPVVERGRRAVDLHPSRTGRAQQTEMDHVVGLLNNIPDPTTQDLKTRSSKPASERSIALYTSGAVLAACALASPTPRPSCAALRGFRARPGPGGVGTLLLGGLQDVQDRPKSVRPVKPVTL